MRKKVNKVKSNHERKKLSTSKISDKREIIKNKKSFLAHINSIFSKAYFVLSIIITMLGFTAFSFFSPKVEASASQTLNDLDPFATLIEIHNAGEFDMSDIKLSLFADEIDTWNIKTKEPYFSFDSIGIEGKVFRKRLVRDGEFWTTRIPFEPLVVMRDPDLRLKYANVRLTVEYKYLWRSKEKRFRFVGGADFNGKVVWTRQPE